MRRVLNRFTQVARRAFGFRKVRNSTTYDAASQKRRLLGWNPGSPSPNAILLNLATLRDRSRAATRNDGYAKGISDELVTNIIGTGIKPLSQADDAEFRRQVQTLWLKWTDESDADGLLDFYGQQAQATRCWHDGGETFVRMRPRFPEDGLSVPLQLQVLEPELCPLTYNAVLGSGNRVRAGIEFDQIGRRVAYWFHPQRPGDTQEFDPYSLRRVPAEFVAHVFLPLRAGQLRGLPNLTQALIKLHETAKFDDATLLRQQLANLFALFVEKPTPAGGEGDYDPLTGLTKGTAGESTTLQLEPGIIQELNPGEKIQFSQPPGVSDNYAAFMEQQLRAISAAAGVPYELLTGDLSKVNDRSVRVILHKFRRAISMLQHQLIAHQLCRPVWKAWMDRAFVSGALPIGAGYATDPEPWARVKWMPQGWPYIHPVQDIQAQKEGIRAGFTTRSAVVSELGEDAEAIDAQQAADNSRADALGLKYDSDGRQAEDSVRQETDEPEPAPTPDQKAAKR